MRKMENYAGSYIVNGTTLIKWNGTQTSIDMQADPALQKVESIANSAFSNSTTLSEIKLPNSLKTIEESAFSACLVLSKITLPQSLEIIKEMAFAHCIALKKIKLPANLTTISGCAFMGCASLTKIDINSANKNFKTHKGVLYNYKETKLVCYPQGKKDTEYQAISTTENIGMLAFESCKNLVNIKLTKSLKTIEMHAFDSCIALKEINLPEGLTIIEESAFQNCCSLKKIKLPNSLKTIDDSSFSRCKSLSTIELNSSNKNFTTDAGVLYNYTKTELILYPQGKIDEEFLMPASVEIIKAYAFMGCRGLKEITFPKGSVLKIIGAMAFYQCSSLQNLNLPDSVNTIGDTAFSECSSLFTLILPKSLTEIGYCAFYACSSLKNISTFAKIPPHIGAEAFDCIAHKPILYIQEKDLSAYKSDTRWNKKFYMFKITEYKAPQVIYNTKLRVPLRVNKTIKIHYASFLNGVA